MAEIHPSTNSEQSVEQNSSNFVSKIENDCDSCSEEVTEEHSLSTDTNNLQIEESGKKKPRGISSVTLRSTNKNKDNQHLPNVGRTGISPNTHSIMKTKQTKDEQDKSIDEETVIEPKTRARKKASDPTEDDKTKLGQDEPKTSKETKKPVNKPKAIIKKRPLGIRKTLRSKKVLGTKEKVKKIIKRTITRGRKATAAVKLEPENSQDKEAVPLIPASEIKKEPLDDITPGSRSSSPKTAGRRQRLSSDLAMMKTMLSDTPNSLALGPRTSPYSMRSERSNSPSVFEGKNLRSGKPRKVKSNLLNEVVMKEQKKRRRLLSDSKASDSADVSDECMKLKRGRSCSRDGSEISKCSDNTESDMSLSEPLNDTDGGKELSKKLDKSKTDLDIDIESNVQISTIEKVPSVNVEKINDVKLDAETSCISNQKKKKKLCLKRSTSLDSDNNNSNRLNLDGLNASEIEDKLLMKTENITLLEARSSILNSMSKTLNSKEITKNIKRARRGRKAAAASRPDPNKNCITSTVTNNTEDKQETLESLSKEIDDLINNLDENIGQDHEAAPAVETPADGMQVKPASSFYGLNKTASAEENTNKAPETPVKNDLLTSLTNENTPSKIDDSETIRLHYEEDPVEKPENSRHEITYKTFASIDKLMDRLKEFEEFDKRRQRLESESKSSDSKPVMVTSDVVLIPKSGVDMKPLKDIQSVRSPEKTFEKENVLSCFENNSAISIVKRDQVRKSIDVDLPNSVTLIKRNSVSARKESTSSNHSKESDAISIFEKSLGKDVTLTELRKSVEKPAPAQVDLHQFATLHANTAGLVGGVVLDSTQISITPRVLDIKHSSDLQKQQKRKPTESLPLKSAEPNDDDKMATIERIKATPVVNVTPAVSISSTPVAIKSPESTPMETEACPPPLANIKTTPDDTTLTSEVSKLDSVVDVAKVDIPIVETVTEAAVPVTSDDKSDADVKPEVSTEVKADVVTDTDIKTPAVGKTTRVSTESEAGPSNISQEAETKKRKEYALRKGSKENEQLEAADAELETEEIKADATKPKEYALRNCTNDAKADPIDEPKPALNTPAKLDCQPGPSNVFNETPETKRHKEYVLRTLGLLTHKAAKEAKIEKLREKERIYGTSFGGLVHKSKSAKSGDYTGTLKTVIKLNRGSGEREKKKQRSSLKMTFQKSKYRTGKPAPEVGDAAAEDDAYYTIERREGIPGAVIDGGHRKSHYSNRLNNHDAEAIPEPAEPKETLNLVIPEKASSFSIHPGRLCQDQCFYCGGKFGLFDTPCHIAQIKSSDRQKKILDNEEKLTIDSCLCDACYRHVDRRANCPSYRKRPPGKQLDTNPLPSPNNTQSEKPVSPPLDEESDEESSGLGAGREALCHTEGCAAPADHSIRRKWLIKMRSSVNKVLKLKCDYPGLHTIPLCGEHHRALAPLMACALCRRRITKHHNVHFIHHGFQELNPILRESGIPVQFLERPLLCKACRYYCSLLQRPAHDQHYVNTYRRKLLLSYNIEPPPGSDHEGDDSTSQDDNAKKKKQRVKSKQRKSTDPEQTSESSERTNDSTPEKDKISQELDSKDVRDEEDIESLISSNKIPVPGAKPTEPSSDCSETENMDFEPTLIHIDKQTELQYLLQKQNNPGPYLKTVKMLEMSKGLMNVFSGIQKPGLQHRVHSKNAKRIHKVGQAVLQKERMRRDELQEEKSVEGIPILKNINLNDECTIETIPNKRPADINTLKNKWQMSESFTQVKKNLSELSKKLTVEKDPKKSDAKYSNPVKRLETNPSISVRELFPGEEEMNLQCNIEFNNVKGVTPEGWEKCNTTIQYDVETKKLWTELQRPYGNQSSFLRHLILLEKYFRSGDLVLAHNASSNASNYSDSVQSRLRAYDHVASDPPARSEAPVSLLEYRKIPSLKGKSLLKSNQTDAESDPKITMPPPMQPKQKSSKEKSKSKPLPPELIAINTPNAQGRKAIQNVIHNIQQLVKGVSASDPTEVASAPLPAKFEPPKEKKDTPKMETPKKPKPASKPWRPTLMPITPENLARIAREPTQVAVDGRHLSSLVQVMSSGKRYHITLQDYNKMCIMRREKLQQLQDGERKRSSIEETTLVTEIQPSQMLGNGGTLLQNISGEDKDKKDETPQIGNAASILKNVGLKNITIAPINSKCGAGPALPRLPPSLTVTPATDHALRL
ncbi:uncharacterized protein LOC114248202 isoform X3 [Bombyx mandarina]|uniref:Uncharacterized protein LOC114248202 isoform X1 n=1 Tax=Bombyx mandarina TaxID=7092 RepID=A0A6J2K5E6_BOMMA|nr:uncharacterized protein LOC114248202 isoform X1 [Bombyx mandarina]XP_028037165.1 uncharacterized protein LOC114248202 isoform X3 [Bombyx mandarina]